MKRYKLTLEIEGSRADLSAVLNRVAESVKDPSMWNKKANGASAAGVLEDAAKGTEGSFWIEETED